MLNLVGKAWHHVKHLKRGSTYEVLGLATVQVSGRDHIMDNDRMVLYQDHETGSYYVRLPHEFTDSRFERLDIDRPHIEHFLSSVAIEASHQRERWGEAHDRSKSAENWFWLIGFLAGKALRAAIMGDKTTALHHTVSAAAALMQWHAAIFADTSGAGVGIDADLKPAHDESNDGYLGADPNAALLVMAKRQAAAADNIGDFIDIVFSGPPSHTSGVFVEVEDKQGQSIRIGEWIKRPDDYWALRIPRP